MYSIIETVLYMFYEAILNKSVIVIVLGHCRPEKPEGSLQISSVIYFCFVHLFLMLELKTFCNKVRPFVTYCNKLIDSYNNTAHNILGKEIKLLLPLVNRKQKRGIITTLVSSFIKIDL